MASWTPGEVLLDDVQTRCDAVRYHGTTRRTGEFVFRNQMLLASLFAVRTWKAGKVELGQQFGRGKLHTSLLPHHGFNLTFEFGIHFVASVWLHQHLCHFERVFVEPCALTLDDQCRENLDRICNERCISKQSPCQVINYTNVREICRCCPQFE